MNFKNEICWILDQSDSMSHLTNQVIKVFNNQIDYLIQRSKELNQETRISIFTFNNIVRNICFDVDVLRTPRITDFYRPDGSTALLDGVLTAIADLEKIPQIHGDFSFLCYVCSDGMNNVNNHKASLVSRKLRSLPENWTFAFFAPDQTAIHEAKNFGFPAANIQLWDVSHKGVEEVGRTIQQATDNFMVARSKGLRGTKNLFNLDTSNLTTNIVVSNLKELRPDQYELLPVRQDASIKQYVEALTREMYKPGSAYYQLTKKETIQANKQICVQNKLNGKVYTGLNARKLLSLPDYEVKVDPANHSEFDVFVQSNSVNRRLIKGQKLIVLK